MLLELTIERLALIDSVRLKLDSGFHVFTGETGAGKSILLDAIGLLVGNRGSAEWIRKDEDSAFVEAVFALSPSVQARVVPLLQDWGIPEEDGTLVISRELFQTGRTVCRVNGRLATVQMLRELGAKLVQQHGQHDTQGLLRPDEQLRMLDLYGRHAEQVAEVRKAYRNYRAALDAYRDSLMGEQERIQRLDMLEFQIREIEDARLQPGEEEMLRERRQRLQHMDKVASALEQAKNYLDGQAVQWLSEAAREVAAAVAYQPSLQETLDLLETAQVHAEEALHQLRREGDQWDLDPAELERIEDRLVQLRSLQRKYGPSVEDVLTYHQTAIQQRDELLNHEANAERLKQALEDALQILQEHSERLHDMRRRAAAKLAKEVEKALRELNMPNALFEVAVTPRVSSDGAPQFGEDGSDHVQFLLSANAGEDAKPIQKVASGGELSRTLLALKSVLAEVDDLGTLIFDEIDAGVSGDTASRVAKMMQNVARKRQVLCVTHSAPVAAAGRWHYHIAKVEQRGRVTTLVKKLDEDGRIDELSRLLGGGIADHTAKTHARALLERMAEKGSAGER